MNLGLPLFTVAICTRQRVATLQQAIQSLLGQLTEQCELLVVDNGPCPETAELVARFSATLHAQAHPATLRYVAEKTPGIAHARNRALSEARGRYILFLDDDEVAEPGWVAAYAEFFNHPPSHRVAAVGGPYLARHEEPPPAWLKKNFGSYDLGSQRMPLTGKTLPAGGNCAYVTRLARKVGGFSTELERCEDTELNWRLREAGYEIWWLPEARIQHLIPARRYAVSAQIRLAFVEGRSMAIYRLLTRKSRAARLNFLFNRCLTTLPQLGLQTALAFVYLLAGQLRAAFRMWLLTCRAAGIGWQLLFETPRVFSAAEQKARLELQPVSSH